MLQCFSKIVEQLEARTPFVCVTLVASRGHAPQDVGARVLVGAHGLLDGTVGGGKVEARAIREAMARLEPSAPARAPELVTWNLQRDLGMSCGGEVSLFFEVFVKGDWQVAVFGAGHVAQKLVPLLLTLDCAVTCLDPRSEWIEKLPRSPKLRVVCATDLAAEVARLPVDAYLVLMTQGHAVDFPILNETLRTRTPPYLGVIGSSVKAQVLRQELREAGISPETSERFHCPMGLPIGSNHPGEIAVSIVAQLIQTRDRLSAIRVEAP